MHGEGKRIRLKENIKFVTNDFASFQIKDKRNMLVDVIVVLQIKFNVLFDIVGQYNIQQIKYCLEI